MPSAAVRTASAWASVSALDGRPGASEVSDLEPCWRATMAGDDGGRQEGPTRTDLAGKIGSRRRLRRDRGEAAHGRAELGTTGETRIIEQAGR